MARLLKTLPRPKDGAWRELFRAIGSGRGLCYWKSDDIEAGRQFMTAWSTECESSVEIHDLQDRDDYFFDIVTTGANQQGRDMFCG